MSLRRKIICSTYLAIISREHVFTGMYKYISRCINDCAEQQTINTRSLLCVSAIQSMTYPGDLSD